MPKPPKDILSIVIVFDGKDPQALLQRVEIARKAVSKERDARWIIVCDACPTSALEGAALLKRLGVTLVATGADLGEWPSFVVGARVAAPGRLLLLPIASSLDGRGFGKLQEASRDHVWVSAVQATEPIWLSILLEFLGSSSKGLGSPLLTRQEAFLVAAGRYDLHEIFFGLRLLNKVRAQQANLITLPLVEGPLPVIKLDRLLGLDGARALRIATTKVEGLVIAVATAMGGLFLYPKHAFIGLGMLCIGSLLFATHFAKQENS